MAVAMHGYSVGPLGMEVVHGPSGAIVRTEPPVDNGGDGSRFSPTDLCAASLGVCASTILRLTAARLGIELRAVGFTLEKHMNASPRRLGRLVLAYTLDTDCPEADFARLEAAGRACPVRLSLGPDVVVEETYARGAAAAPEI
jgi:putative redox protein